MIKKGAPKIVWDYGFVHQAGVLSRLARGRNGQTGIEEVTGNTPYISEWLDFDFYDRVWWLDTKKPATNDDNVTLNRWLGISHKIGSDMCYWVLTVSGNVIARTTVQHVNRDEYLDLVMCERIKEFDEKIEKRLDDTNFVNPEARELYIDEFEYENEAAHRDGTQMPDDDEYADMNTEERPKQDDVDFETYDKYIGSEVMMDVPGEGPNRATVRRRIENEVGS